MTAAIRCVLEDFFCNNMEAWEKPDWITTEVSV